MMKLNGSEREDLISKIQEVFFRAMMAGYAGGTKDHRVTKTTACFGNEKIITFVEGDFVVIDRYFVSPDNDYSFGMTVILYKNDPVWRMFYSGFYPKNTISTLKEALRTTYSAGKFCGGRGPLIWEGKDYTYFNRLLKGSFSDFAGREEIFPKGGIAGEFMGFHDYSGGISF